MFPYHNIFEYIAENGKISVADLMSEVMYNNSFGYYLNKNPIGKTQDFITSPEVSQLFGEMIGVWCAHCWCEMGKPDDFILVEMGPGHGTLMKDLLRATKHVQGFHKAMNIHLIEINPILQKIQHDNLAEYQDIKFHWHKSLYQLPKKPMLLIANEFFDVLPIEQYIKLRNRWYERIITFDEGSNKLAFSEISTLDNTDRFLKDENANAKDGSIVEISPASIGITKTITDHIMATGGFALIIDYGYDYHKNDRSYYMPTLQAIKNHQYHPILNDLGEADLSAHVDFANLKSAAEVRGAKTFGAIYQADFLQNMGINLRARMLLHASDNEDQKQDILQGLERLTSHAQMGMLFKAIAITNQ